MPQRPDAGRFQRELLLKLLMIVGIVGLLALLEKCGVIHRW